MLNVIVACVSRKVSSGSDRDASYECFQSAVSAAFFHARGDLNARVARRPRRKPKRSNGRPRPHCPQMAQLVIRDVSGVVNAQCLIATVSRLRHLLTHVSCSKLTG
ncbi:unnamed protein product [Soboliphyme baturini]|uniref:Secreted protein n=1 Tax=Soboliphyme baturini TaxID=241478 RepID=A0A183IRT3_9BILA|nr:unnamed protein product [Soboliphyme baturini]